MEKSHFGNQAPYRKKVYFSTDIYLLYVNIHTTHDLTFWLTSCEFIIVVTHSDVVVLFMFVSFHFVCIRTPIRWPSYAKSYSPSVFASASGCVMCILVIQNHWGLVHCWNFVGVRRIAGYWCKCTYLIMWS